jgi:hypothetical protein
MKHVHRWRTDDYLLLGLPNAEGFSERITRWRCRTCPAFCDITGEVRHQFPLGDPSFWDRIVTEQARRDIARLVQGGSPR